MSDQSQPSTPTPAQTLENVGVIVIHGVGEAEIGWINDHIVNELAKREPAMGLARHSEVYRLPDKGRTKPNATFRTVVRRARIADRVTVAFAELHWADLSRVGSGAVSRFLTVLQLFFEAPQVLGSTLLAEPASGVRGLIRYLILASIWLLRWPIAGMTTSLFISSLCLMLYDRLVRFDTMKPLLGMPPNSLQYLVGGSLAVTALLGLTLAYVRYRHDIALTDLGISTAIFSSLMLAGVAVAGFLDAVDLQDRYAYLAIIGDTIIATFALWNFTIIGSMALMLTVLIGRNVGDRASQRYALHRAAAAAGLTVMQGMLWKLVVCPVSLFVVFMLVDRSGGTRCNGDNCAWATQRIFKIVDSLVIVALSNVVMTCLVVVAISVVAAARQSIGEWRDKALMAGRCQLPRLIANPLILSVLFLGQFGSAAMFYYAQHVPEVAGWLKANILDDETVNTLRDVLTGSLLTLLPTILGALTKASAGVLHVARDVVDHQYAPRYVVAKFRLPTWLQQRGTHPRRERIHKRLEALIEGIMAVEKFDRLVFLTHSQGTVIAHDYLRSVRDKKMPASIKRIDVITLASPLSHIYQHYFRTYEMQTGSAAALNPKLASWTNMWRIDDPIGGRVDIVEGDFIRNEPMRRGGHVNYWREERVCEVILDVIDPTSVPQVVAAGKVAAGVKARTVS